MRCLAVDRDDLAARANLGWTFLDLGLASAARVELERCLAVDPSFGPALAGIETLARRGMIDGDRQALVVPGAAPATVDRSGSPGGASP
jgi:hypothetical protein